MNPPNFFFVGTGKSGTSSLTHYLSNHPQVFITTPRETYFFAQDLAYQVVPAETEQEYLELFRNAKPEQIRLGEASVFYMFSSLAIPEIAQRFPDAKLFAVLRNPLEMIPALHDQFVYTGMEDISSFHEAWEASAARSNGENLPKAIKNGRILDYRSIAKYGEQLERVFEHFPRAQVSLHNFDDFVANPGAVYLDIVKFLGVDPILPAELPQLNKRKSVRFNFVPGLLRKNPAWLRMLKKISHATFGKSTGILNWLVQKNTVPKKKLDIDQRILKAIASEYSSDMMKLCDLTDKIFDNWLEDFENTINS
jgi:hypothetical protein